MSWLEMKLSNLTKELEKQSTKKSSIYHRSRYKDGKWDYQADNVKGIKIVLTCTCGHKHVLKLGADMAVLKDEEIIDIDPIEIRYNGMSGEVGYESQCTNIKSVEGEEDGSTSPVTTA